jgi:HTH-type transcriptional regulator/antitoxin HigA
MNMRRPAEIFPPGDFIREELEARDWTQGDLAAILARPLQLVNEIVLGKRAITPETAQGLASAFNTSPELWLNLESAYQLSKLKTEDSIVARRARLYEKAPVKEMVRRHWIEPSGNIEVLEKRVIDFYGIPSLDQEPQFWPFAARSSRIDQPSTTQWAWLFRARKLAKAVHAERFADARFDLGIEALKTLLLSPEEIRKVPKILADAGIRLVILESLPGSRIDGACFWLDKTSPVVALSLRYDRIDGFWHTLFHELGHVKNRHGLNAHESVDTDLVGNDAQGFTEKSEVEQKVDRFATEHLVPTGELDFFIARVKPLYSKFKIMNFADRVKVHPGIVLGQLQYRKEIPYSHNRDLLVRIREIITKTALTDGWGNVPVGI